MLRNNLWDYYKGLILLLISGETGKLKFWGSLSGGESGEAVVTLQGELCISGDSDEAPVSNMFMRFQGICSGMYLCNICDLSGW